MMKLLQTPSPKEGQSASCYLRDIAKANLFGSEENLKRYFFDRAMFESEELTLRQFCFLLNRNEEHFDGLMLTRAEDKGAPVHEYGYLRIPSYHLRRGEWYCPECLRRDRYMHAVWKIGWLPFCTKHRRLLVEATPEVKLALFNDCDIPVVSAPQSENLFHYNLLEVQLDMEQRLAKERKVVSRPNLLAEIDYLLERCLHLNKAEDLWKRKKRYPMRYFPLNIPKTLHFLECMAVQEAA